MRKPKAIFDRLVWAEEESRLREAYIEVNYINRASEARRLAAWLLRFAEWSEVADPERKRKKK